MGSESNRTSAADSYNGGAVGRQFVATSKFRREEETLPPAEEFVVAESVAQPSSPADQLSLLPPDGQTPDEAARNLPRHPELDIPLPEREPEPAPRPAMPWRFSLFELLAAMTFICLELGAATWLPLEVFVGIVGLITVFWLIVFSLFAEPDSRLTKLAWWTFLTTYLGAALVALIRACFR